MGWVIVLVVLLIAGPAAAWLGRRHGRVVRGTAALAFVLLGLGQVTDPPKRNLIEAIEGEDKAGEATGEPKDAAGGS